MKVVKINPNIKYLYHYTLKSNVDKILSSKEIISEDKFVFFTGSLEDSIMVFNNEIMAEGKLYIDVKGNLRRREKCNKDDYCILKIPYINDNNFYRFEFKNSKKDSTYNLSIAHKGKYTFKAAKMIEFPKTKQRNNMFYKIALTGAIAGMLLIPYNVYADSWLDSGNYDTSWWNNNAIVRTLENEKDFAGLAYLVNEKNITFEGVDFNDFVSSEPVKLYQKEWEPMKNSFNNDTMIEGLHRIILDLADNFSEVDWMNKRVRYRVPTYLNGNTNTLYENVITGTSLLSALDMGHDFQTALVTNGYGYDLQALEVYYHGVQILQDESLKTKNIKRGEAIDVYDPDLIGYYLVSSGESGERKILIEPTDDVIELRKRYSTLTNLPAERICLLYNNTILEDGHTIAEYHIPKGATLEFSKYPEYIITIVDGVSDKASAAKGEQITITAALPPKGKKFDKWVVKEGNVTLKEKYRSTKFIMPNEDVVIQATYKNVSSSGSSTSYTITTKIENGTITPSNNSIKKNENQEYTFEAEEGYEIVDVLVDGKSVGVVESYQLEKVTEKHTIEVKTAKISALTDIDGWAKEEMAEAEEKGLIPETFISKNASKAITREEFCAVAVKLYEALTGKKATTVDENPFIDTNDTYVLKAYQLGITTGISETEFGLGTITREQMATMLTRALKVAGIDVTVDLENVTPFADDSDLSDWSRASVYFMAEKEIIKGIGDNRFNALGNAKVQEAIAIALRCVATF